MTALTREVTWVEPHLWLLVVVAEVPFSVEWNVRVPHVGHWFDNPSFEWPGVYNRFVFNLTNSVCEYVLVEWIEEFGHIVISRRSAVPMGLEELAEHPKLPGLTDSDL